MKLISIETNPIQNWIDGEKVLDLVEFEKSKNKFENYMLKKYLYEINTIRIQQQIKDDFDILVTSYFHKMNMDISFNDIASLHISENGMFIVPLSNIAGVVFFTDKRKEFWDEFVKLCNLRQKDKLIEI